MSSPLTIVIVEKTGTLKNLTVKDFKEEELFKKCGFRTNDGFNRQAEWKIKLNSNKYFVQVFGKSEGRANNENKYDFPPPIDTKLLFGNCAIICYKKNDTTKSFINLTLDLWEKLYEKLFGGFEDLSKTVEEDDLEEDELSKVPSKFKTKTGGYLKDGFVVDSDESDEDNEDDESEILSSVIEEDEIDDIEDILEEEDEEEENHKKKAKSKTKTKVKPPNKVIDIVDMGSELSEDDYE